MRISSIRLLAALWLAGCAFQGTPYHDRASALGALAVGSTTSSEVRAAWGLPLRDVIMQDGRHVLTYQYIDPYSENGTFGTITSQFAPLGSTTTAVTGQITLTFDPKGVLIDYATYGLS
jgi:hypothetical protein